MHVVLSILQQSCYFGCFFDLLIDISISRAEGAYMYNLPYAYAYALYDMRRITLVLMHILIQPPSSYKSSFSYKTSNGVETHDLSTHATRAGLVVLRYGSWREPCACILWYREKGEGESLEIYTGGICPCSSRTVYQTCLFVCLFVIMWHSAASGHGIYPVHISAPLLS
jgi:hypothetical protein